MGQHALIADSEPAHAVIYAALLKQEGVYPVIVRDLVAVAASLAERGPPVIAVIDLALGLEVVERVRRAAPATVLPIIAVSALRMDRDLATSHRARLGLSAILAKAASEESFRRVARRLLGITPSEDLEMPPPSRVSVAADSSGPRSRFGDAPISEGRSQPPSRRLGLRR